MNSKAVVITLLCFTLLVSALGFTACSAQTVSPVPENDGATAASMEADPEIPADSETSAPSLSPAVTPDELREDSDTNSKLESLVLDEGTLFIGDSITHHLVSRYLRPQGYLGQASYMACSNAGLPHFFADWAALKPADWNSHGCSYNPEFEGLTYGEAIEQSAGRYSQIYFMMGSNGSGKLSYDAYKEAVDHIAACHPKATIYLQTIPNCPTGQVYTDKVNTIVRDTVAACAAEGRDNVVLLDTNSIWVPECIARDGVHLTDFGLETWYAYILENRAD